MAIEKEINLNVNSNIEGSIGQLKSLKRELKGVEVGTEEFKKLYNQIDDLEDKIKSAKNKSSDWIDSLAAAGGPVGLLGDSINRLKVSTQSFGGALKATGIGLIVGLVASLAAAFNDNERAQKKLQPLLEGLEKIFNGIFTVVEPLFNTLVDLAVYALPMVSEAFGVVYASVSAVFQSLGALGSAIGKLIKGDFSGAWKDAKSSVNDFGDNYDKANKRFQDGSKELSKTEKEELSKRREEQKKHQEELAKKQKEAADKAAEERKRAAEEKKAKEAKDLQEFLEFQKTIRDAEAEDAAEKQKLRLEGEKNTLDSLNKIADEQDKIDADYAKKQEDKLKADKELADAKKAILVNQLEETAKTLNGIADLFGKQTAAGKTAAVAGATIETFLAAQKAYSATVGIPVIGPVLAPINAGLAVAAGFKNIKSILDVQVPSGGGGGSDPAMSAPAAPSFNVVGNSGVNQVANVLQNQGAAPVQAYVVANNVTTQQGLNRNIVSNATLG